MILVTGGTGASQKFVKTESRSESFINPACSREQRKPYPVSDYFFGDASTGYPTSSQAGKPLEK